MSYHVECRCGEIFEPDLVDVAREDGGVRRQFACPSCGRVYPVADITAHGVALMEELQDVELRSSDAERTIATIREELKGEVTRAI